jgi:hypothetical protein
VKAKSLIPLREVGMLIFVIEWSQEAKEPLPNFLDAFAEFYLGKLLAFFKCFSWDRRDGGINSNMDNILRSFSSSIVDPN